jgi:hypothetical protein
LFSVPVGCGCGIWRDDVWSWEPVSVVPVNPAGVVVPCGRLMLQGERHGRGDTL